MNKVFLTGNAGKDPEITTVSGDKKVAKFSIAVNEYSGGKEKGQTTMWVNIVAWDKNAENLAKFLKKGHKVNVWGRLSIRDYEKDGVKKQATEVILEGFDLLHPKSEGVEAATETPQVVAPSTVMAGDTSDSDLPF